MQSITLKTKYLKICLLLIIVFIFQSSAMAQDTIPTQIPDLDEQIDITLEPKVPEPNDNVTISLDAYGVDLNNSAISWTANGKTVLEGKGQKVLKINAGKQGQITKVVATITPPNSKILTESVTISPQSVDILWEANTYTPPFYKGKALFSSQENVKFVAMPNLINANGAFANPNGLIYTWSQDGEVQQDKSGTGKNTYAYTDSILGQPVDIDLKATDGGDLIAENSISIAPTNTEMYVYEKNPLYGMLFNKDLSSLFDIGSNPEGTMSAYPYFYGITNRSDSNISYVWSINGSAIDVPQSQNDMTFRNTQNIDGKSKVGIEASNNNNALQQNSIQTLINFQKSTSGFSF